MASHEPDLREEVQDESEVMQIQEDYRRASLDPATMQLLDFAAKLTSSPKEMAASDIEGLRARKFMDEDILDAVQLVAYFNYINRVIDGLGADPEPGMRYANGSGP